MNRKMKIVVEQKKRKKIMHERRIKKMSSPLLYTDLTQALASALTMELWCEKEFGL